MKENVKLPRKIDNDERLACERSVPRSERDHPLGFHWRPLDTTSFDCLNLPPPRSDAEAASRDAILTEAVLVGRGDPGRFISYSRRQAFYSDTRRYRGADYTFTNVTRTVDLLAAHGLVDHEKMPPGNLGRQSRFRPADALLEAVGAAAFPVAYTPAETLVLKDRDGNLINYHDTDRTDRLRRPLAAINEALKGTAVSHPELGRIREGDPVVIDGNIVTGAARTIMHRVFTGDWNRHGRFYGPSWQNLPKAERARLQINGSEVVEADYPRLHVTLAYGMAGAVPDGDPYDISGWPVPLVKKAVNILFNAKNRKSARQALAQEIGGTGAFARADSLLTAVERRHAPIASLFGSDAGLMLMNRDATMAMGVMMQLLKQGQVALGIHDSFIVPAGAKGNLLEAMADQLEREVAGKTPYVSVGSLNRLPHMVPAPSLSWSPGASPLVVVVLPLDRGDLFGGIPVSLSANDLFGWRAGIAPLGVRTALLREIRRRGLRHGDLARMVGLSGAQLSNIIHGRFGASAETAERLRRFLLEVAETVKASAA